MKLKYDGKIKTESINSVDFTNGSFFSTMN